VGRAGITNSLPLFPEWERISPVISSPRVGEDKGEGEMLRSFFMFIGSHTKEQSFLEFSQEYL